MEILPQVVKNLAKVKAGSWITKSAFRNPVLALAIGGSLLGYKLWKDHKSSKPTGDGEAVAH